jgi:predicted outer membrane repeat protein
MRILTLLALSTPSLAAAATFEVSAEEKEGYVSLEDALAAAVSGDDIKLSPGSYGDLVIDDGRSLVIAGTGATTTFRSVVVDSHNTELTLRDVALEGGVTGAEIRGGSLNLESVRIRGFGQPGAAGAAIIARPASRLNAVGVSISEVHSLRGAVQVFQDATVSMTSSVFSSNGAEQDGGAIFSQGGTLSVRSSMFNGNSAGGGGGAIAVVGGLVEIEDTVFTSSLAHLGGALLVDGTGVVAISDSTFDGNSAEVGGHIYQAGGRVSSDRDVYTAGSARMGGAVAMDGGNGIFSNSRMSHQGPAEQGGAVYIMDGDLTLLFSVLYRNAAQIGGGVAQSGGKVLMRGVIAARNQGEALATAGGEATFDQSLVWQNEGLDGDDVLGLPVPNTVITGPPGFVAAELGDFNLSTGSPGLDFGVGGAADPDGTPADMGLYGGPSARPLEDKDGDGYVRGRDCDDSDPEVNEGMVEHWYDGIDANCDRYDDFDQDGDGEPAAGFGGADCDDTDPRVFPGAFELAGDKLDADCDGLSDPDMDGDGWGSGMDCDDLNPSARPDATETWYDGVDADCDGHSDFDKDGDGYDSIHFGGLDCDDEDPFRSPMTAEIIGDGIDQDCDGADLEAARGEEVAESRTVEPAEEADLAPEADPFAQPRSRDMTTTGCSTTGGMSGTGLGGLALFAGLMSLFGRRRQD